MDDDIDVIGKGADIREAAFNHGDTACDVSERFVFADRLHPLRENRLAHEIGQSTFAGS